MNITHSQTQPSLSIFLFFYLGAEEWNWGGDSSSPLNWLPCWRLGKEQPALAVATLNSVWVLKHVAKMMNDWGPTLIWIQFS